jgi:hypothetical protein
MGTIEEATLYLENGFYIALTGYLCKVSLKISNFWQNLSFLMEINIEKNGVR